MNRLTFLILALCASCEKPTPTGSHIPANTQKSTSKMLADNASDDSETLSKHSSPIASTSNEPNGGPRPINLSSLSDRGIFSDLDDQVTLTCPSWLADAPWLTLTHADHDPRVKWRALAGIPLCPADSTSDPVLVLSPASDADQNNDADQDGIPDAIDLLRGAKKTVLNAAEYRGGYHVISFPGGDVPRNQGVCTDVIVRALRNAGIDLQALLSSDIKERASAYPMIKKADPNIDHRRVRTLLPYFEAHYLSLSTQPSDHREPFFPGDILFMNTLGDSAPEHMGIVSDHVGKSGLPLIINNWTDGTRTAEMDLLTFVPVTHRFRVTHAVNVPESEQGLDGLARQVRLTLPAKARQAIAVVTPLWTSNAGFLSRWTRTSATSAWTLEDDVIPVVLGSLGLGRGRGIGQASLAPRKKTEGDKRSPAGVFTLGTAFGRARAAPYAGKYPYRRTGESDYWVDDPDAPEYNTWRQLPPGSTPPWSAERLAMYELGLVVNHNVSPVQREGGSAIFIHPWQSDRTPTVGCTALPIAKLVNLLGWLDETQSPVLVQTAGHIFARKVP